MDFVTWLANHAGEGEQDDGDTHEYQRADFQVSKAMGAGVATEIGKYHSFVQRSPQLGAAEVQLFCGATVGAADTNRGSLGSNVIVPFALRTCTHRQVSVRRF